MTVQAMIVEGLFEDLETEEEMHEVLGEQIRWLIADPTDDFLVRLFLWKTFEADNDAAGNYKKSVSCSAVYYET